MRQHNISSQRTTVITEEQNRDSSLIGQRSAPLIIQNPIPFPRSLPPRMESSEVAQRSQQVEEIFDLETSVALLESEIISIREDLMYMDDQEAELNDLIEGLPEIEERNRQTYELNMILRDSTRRMAHLWDSFSRTAIPTAVLLWNRIGESVPESVIFNSVHLASTSLSQTSTTMSEILRRSEQNAGQERQQDGIEIFSSAEALSRSDRIAELKKKITELRAAVESESSVLDERVRTFEINYTSYKKRLNSLCQNVYSVTKFIAAVTGKFESIVFYMLNAFKIKKVERIKNKENEVVKGIKNASI